MKSIALTLILSLFLVTISPVSAQTTQEVLTNNSVIELSKSGLSNDIIIAKIKQSKTEFDLSSVALQQLKNAGIAANVIMAMLEQNTVKTIPPISTPETEIKVPDGTEIEVELKNPLSGETANVGDIVDLTVVKDIEINGIKVILKGFSATAKITLAKKAGYWGKKGLLEWQMIDVQTISGRIPARFTKIIQGETRTATVATAMVVTGILFFPAAPLWGLKKGKKAELPAGTKFSVFTNKDAMLKVNIAQPN